METKSRPNFWWLKSTPTLTTMEKDTNLLVPKLNLRPSTSLVDLLEKEKVNLNSNVDVGSIIEEINRVAAQSPLGPYKKSVGDRSIDDLMKEAEKIYLESSKSFEQLSQRSKTSQNISDLCSKDSTPTPRSLSPLPMDPHQSEDEYTEDFSEESKMETTPPANVPSETAQSQNVDEGNERNENRESSISISKSKSLATLKDSQNVPKIMTMSQSASHHFDHSQSFVAEFAEHHKDADFGVQYEQIKAELELKNGLISTLQENNRSLKFDMEEVKLQLQKTNTLLEQTKAALDCKPSDSLELNRTLEQLKDSREINTALQLQLDAANRSHHQLKTSYEDLLRNAKLLEHRFGEVDVTLVKYKEEITSLKSAKDESQLREAQLGKLLELEKLQTKSLKAQQEKDAKCIQDLNRQIKEMERIVARKHPDSVSALIVAAKENCFDSRRVLEERIKELELEKVQRDAKSSEVFAEIQEKFAKMKGKYESHIEDLETHVEDLKRQLKRKVDTYDVYTQTVVEEKEARKECLTVFTQTDRVQTKTIVARKQPEKEEVHLLATIRGLQADLANKEKVIVRLQKEVEDARKTNRRLQKEREGSLKNSMADHKRGDFRSYPERLAAQAARDQGEGDDRRALRGRIERLEEELVALKNKRIQDLTALQEAHERELSECASTVEPLRAELELQRVSVAQLQRQLAAAKEELALVERLSVSRPSPPGGGGDGSADADGAQVAPLLNKIAFLEKRYHEREFRLRAIVHSLAQKSAMTTPTDRSDRSCAQCAERQRQLIAYKAELDQLLNAVRALQH